MGDPVGFMWFTWNLWDETKSSCLKIGWLEDDSLVSGSVKKQTNLEILYWSFWKEEKDWVLQNARKYLETSAGYQEKTETG